MNSIAANPRLRIASYNALNLFDDIDDPGKRDEGTPAKSADSQRALADVILSSDADVIAMQEVEKLSALKDFRDQNGLREEYPHLVLVEGNDKRGIDVALMSKFPVNDVVSHKDEVFPVKGQKPRGFLRDLLQADIEVPEYGEVRFFVTHLASKMGGKRADRMRIAEARAAREIIKEETADFPGQKYVILGDFNDTPDSPAVQEFKRKDKDGWGMVDAFAPEPDAVSYPTREDKAKKWGYKRIDHILLSPEMAETLVDQEVHHHPKDEKASDHWMVSADFELSA